MASIVTESPPVVYTLAEAAEILKVSQSTVRGWVRSGALAAAQRRHVLRIPLAAINRFLADHQSPT